MDENSLDEAGAEQLQENLPAKCATSEHAPTLNLNKSKAGRKEGTYYKLLGYVPTTVVNTYGKRKTLATCLVCHKKICNTSAERLYVHR